jgi:hypothetical protein
MTRDNIAGALFGLFLLSLVPWGIYLAVIGEFGFWALLLGSFGWTVLLGIPLVGIVGTIMIFVKGEGVLK